MGLTVTAFVKAIVARLLFAVHGVLVAWRVTDIEDDKLFYLLLIPVVMLPIEMIFTLKFTDNGEWKWFCPSVLLYLASVIPGIYLLELQLYENRIEYRDEQGWEECTSDIMINSSGVQLSEISGVTIPLTLSESDWVLALEQVLLCLLVLGRWLLPKGALTRDQLSQLLLVYIGMAADILEFSIENLKEDNVKCNAILIYMILGLWAWSLLQFTLVLTSVSGAKVRMFKKTKRMYHCRACICCENEIWALSISLIMQDGPFLAMRLYLLIHHQVVNQMMIFFTCKNMLVIMLQAYRILIVCSDTNTVEPSEVSGEAVEVMEDTSAPDKGPHSGDTVALALDVKEK
ncbi:transmembrane protein 26-like [Anneissia japonica]|uniref:transmembrane protein 26-like n=1 Tax=Anneissia japonica TaxID=1529436 RepID=UPI001425B3E7|nr:transmembrane protein 26-like [Anneissia japonica]